MGRKAIVQIGGAIVSGLNAAIPMTLNVRGLFPDWPWQYHAIIGFLAFAFFMAWIIRDKQREIDAKRERIRLVARPGSYAIDYPTGSEQPLENDEASITATIYFEIWSAIDAYTSKLILNLIGISHRRWYQPLSVALFWRMPMPLAPIL